MTLKSFVFGVASLLLLTSCGADLEDVDEGTVRVTWTVAGSQDPAACAQVGASAFEFVVFDEGLFVAEVEAPCTAFELTFPLLPDDYVGRATLVNTLDLPETQRLAVPLFTVRSNTTTELAVDFPQTSFLP